MLSLDYDRKKDIEDRRNKVAQAKEISKKNIDQAVETVKKQKQKNYKESLTEKELTNTVIKSYNKKLEKHNKAQYTKIKSEHNKLKEDELKTTRNSTSPE